MRYVVFWRVLKGTPMDRLEPYAQEICGSEESLVATIQNLQIDPQTARKYTKKIDIKVGPYFEKGQLVLNLKTLATRIVRDTNYIDGILYVYNSDNPHEAELQENGYIPMIPEEWNISDCIPVNIEKARNEHNFQFGTEMGEHPKYKAM